VSNALFKGKIGGSRVAAKWLILAFLASKGTQNHTLFHVFGGQDGWKAGVRSRKHWLVLEYSDTIFDFSRTNFVFFRTISEYSGSIVE